MDFWGRMVNVSEEAAARQVAIVSSFSKEKKMKIALQFANFGIERSRKWIHARHPEFSEPEITLEFVRLFYYETGEMSEAQWQFYQTTMQGRVRKHWAERFRRMMKQRQLKYEDVAKMIGSSESSVKSTISRGLPRFAKLAVLLHEGAGSMEMDQSPTPIS